MEEEAHVQHIDHKPSNANAANETFPTDFTVGKNFAFGVKQIAIKDLKLLVEKATEVLASRRLLPPNLSYEPHVSASLLTLLRELRDRTYESGDLQIPRSGTING